MDAETSTVIDASASVEGKLKGKDARILGRFKGELELTGRLELGEAARVEATVRAGSAELAGSFDGRLSVERLVLLEKARVAGTVDARQIVMREGAVLNGAIDVGPGERAGRGATPGAPTQALTPPPPSPQPLASPTAPPSPGASGAGSSEPPVKPAADAE